MQPHKPDQVTRVRFKHLPDVNGDEFSHVTTRFMPFVTGSKAGVEAVRAGLLQMAQLPDGTTAFRPIHGAN